MTVVFKSSKRPLRKFGIGWVLPFAFLLFAHGNSLAGESWSHDDLEAFIDGATIMAAGGGGSPTIAKQLLTKYFPVSGTVELDEVSDIPSGQSYSAASIGAIGSPAELFKLPDPLSLPYNVYAAMDLTYEKYEKAIKYLMPIEVGAINGLYAFLLAEKLNSINPENEITVLDVDGGGRSVPTLPLLMYSYFPDVYDQSAFVTSQFSAIPPSHPFPTEWALLTAAGGSQDRIENTILSMLSGNDSPYKGAAGYGSFYASADDISDSPPVTGQIGVAHTVGNTYAESPEGSEVASALSDEGRSAKSVFSGKVTDITLDTSGLDYGVVTITGTGSYDGRKFTIQYENENICAYSDHYSSTEPYILGPDSIAYVPTDGIVFDNSDLYELVHTQKQQPAVDVVAIKADDQVLDMSGIMEAWSSVRAAIPKGACDFPYSSPWED